MLKCTLCFDTSKNLEDDIKSELTGNFEKVVCGLLMYAPVYDAYELRNAIKVSESFKHRPLCFVIETHCTQHCS